MTAQERLELRNIIDKLNHTSNVLRNCKICFGLQLQLNHQLSRDKGETIKKHLSTAINAVESVAFDIQKEIIYS